MENTLKRQYVLSYNINDISQYSETKRKEEQKNMSGNEILFYGGITVFICSGIAAVISFGALKLKAIRLYAKFDEEYGKEKKEKPCRK